MGHIKILDESVSNIIAAGEVVENPASMIKEMIENSLDAKSTMIKIEVFNGGLDVKIIDNGTGMDKDDVLLSIERHATSKIRTKDDVFNLQTYGFRGEALASIAAVSKLIISTRCENSNVGYKVESDGGIIKNFEEISKNIGTEIEVKNLFYNTPARKKFLRKESTEYNKIRDIVLKESLVNSDVSFSLSFDGKSSISTSGKGVENTILELFGKNILKNVKKFEYGYLGNVEILRSSKDYIFTYVNKRYVKSNIIERSVIDGYYTKLMKGKYPFVIIFLDVDPKEIDVNVHPSKKVVKFSNDRVIYKQIKESIDEHFYYNDRENWQPNIDLLKQNVNVENKDEKITNLFVDEVIKTESNPFFSFESNAVSQKINTFETEKQEKLENIMEYFNELSSKKIEVKESKIEINEENKEYLRGTFEKININDSINYDVIGQIFNTYILVRKENELEIYDQHIIHERILYEELKEKFYSKKLNSKQLLLPEKMEITEVEKNIVMDNINLFKEFGFDVDELNNELIFRAVPDFDFRKDIKGLFLNIIEDLKKEKEITDLRENIIISMSCKGAVKAGQKLDMDEMKRMVKRLHEVGEYTCPHGRPIIVKLSKDDLDKMFGRKK